MAWTQTSTEIITKAFRHLGVLDANQVMNGSDFAVGMDALNAILKELPIHGFSWPKVTSTNVSMSWSSGTPDKVSLPADYFGNETIFITENGILVRLRSIPKAVYDAQDRSVTALYPIEYYISPDDVVHLFPIPTFDPGLKLSYQSVITDAAAATQPSLPIEYLNGLSWWVAYECRLAFSVFGERAIGIEKMHLSSKQRMLEYATETSPIIFEVVD